MRLTIKVSGLIEVDTDIANKDEAIAMARETVFNSDWNDLWAPYVEVLNISGEGSVIKV